MMYLHVVILLLLGRPLHILLILLPWHIPSRPYHTALIIIIVLIKWETPIVAIVVGYIISMETLN